MYKSFIREPNQTSLLIIFTNYISKLEKRKKKKTLLNLKTTEKTLKKI